MLEFDIVQTHDILSSFFNYKNLDVAILKSKAELIIVTKHKDYILNNLVASKLLMWDEKEITMLLN